MDEQTLDVLEYLTEDGHNPFRELLCAGNKRSQTRDIEIAQARWEDYLRRIE